MASHGEASKPDQSSAEAKTVNSSELKAQVLGPEESQNQKAQYRRTLILFFDGTANEYSSRNTVKQTVIFLHALLTSLIHRHDSR